MQNQDNWDGKTMKNHGNGDFRFSKMCPCMYVERKVFQLCFLFGHRSLNAFVDIVAHVLWRPNILHCYTRDIVKHFVCKKNKSLEGHLLARSMSSVCQNCRSYFAPVVHIHLPSASYFAAFDFKMPSVNLRLW